MKLSIIIPVYNDRDFLETAIAQIRAVRFSIAYEIIAVDDGSTDGSRELLGKIPNIKVILHQKNQGKGGAIKTGIQHATGEIIAIQDDDCEYEPAALPKLIAPILHGETQVVYGSRFLQKNQMFNVQRLENKALTWLANLLLGLNLTDVATGHKVFTREVATKLLNTLTKPGFEVEMDITVQIARLGYSIRELPTRYRARTKEQGKKITYRDGIRTVRFLLTAIVINPLHTKNGQVSLRRMSSTWPGKVGAVVVLVAATFLPRLITLGSILTIDEPLWQSRSSQFITAFSTLQMEKTLIAGQPGITTAWLAGLTLPWNTLAVQQTALALGNSMLLLIATYLLTILFGFWWGILAGLFLALDPFLIGHSRIVHTDALLAGTMLVGILAVLTALRRTTPPNQPIKRYIIASGAFASLAILTKLFGLLLIPIVAVLLIRTWWRGSIPFRNATALFLAWLSAGALTTVILWPALLSDGGRVYSYLTERTSLHAEGTRSEETTSRWWYYGRESLFRLTPLTTLLLPVAVVSLLARDGSIQARTVRTLLAAGLFYTLVLSFSSDKSDRYILFTHLTFVVASAYGLQQIVSWLTRKGYRWQHAAIIVSLAATWLAGENLTLHPYYLAHYNRLYPIEKYHKLGWGEGLEQAAVWITQHDAGAKVASYYPRVFSYFYRGPVDDIGHIDESTARYAVLYRSMFERGPGHPDTDIVNSFQKQGPKPAHIVTINGLPYVWIYRIKQ